MNANDYLNEPIGVLRIGDYVRHREIATAANMHIIKILHFERMATCSFFDGAEQVEASFALYDLVLERRAD